MKEFVQLRPDLPAWRRSSADEIVNAATHGLGLVVAVVGAFVRTASVLSAGDASLVIACELYLGSLIAVYAMSTLSHIAKSLRWKSLFRQLDQACIYLLIVATYTPFSLAYLPGRLWWALLVAMWAVAITMFTAKLFFGHRVEEVSVASYVVLGWTPILSIPALLAAAPAGAIATMVAGGLCYTFGTLFLIYDERVRHFHAAWHLCVIAGSACHFLGILVFIVGAGR